MPEHNEYDFFFGKCIHTFNDISSKQALHKIASTVCLLMAVLVILLSAILAYLFESADNGIISILILLFLGSSIIWVLLFFSHSENLASVELRYLGWRVAKIVSYMENEGGRKAYVDGNLELVEKHRGEFNDILARFYAIINRLPNVGK